MNSFKPQPPTVACDHRSLMSEDTPSDSWDQAPAPSWGERRLHLISGQKAPSAPLRKLLESGLGYRVSVAQGKQEGLILAKRPGFDLILLELGHADAGDWDIADWVLRFGGTTPIIVLAHGAGDRDEVQALDGGASDYIRLPCPSAVVLARIRAHVRQFLRSEHAELSLGPYLFRPGARELLEPATKARIRLTRTENALLRYLYWQNGRPVSQYDLLTEVWGYSAKVCSHTVQTHIYRLRKKIERDPANPFLIQTGADGYALTASAASGNW